MNEFAQMSDNDQQHIDSICRRHNIRWMGVESALDHLIHEGDLHLIGNSFGIQSRNPFTYELIWRGVHVAEQGEDEKNYFVALHELGHVILEHDDPVDWDQRVAMEIEACEWAFEHAQYFPSDETVCDTLDALSTYTHKDDAIARGEITGVR